jgi:hypothetical protein
MPDMHGSDITKAGDYKISKMVLKSGINEKYVDIRGLYTNFEVFEDMFSPYITAKIYMIDSVNLPEQLPIRGQETLELEFVTDFSEVKPVKKTFKVYKIDSQIIDDNGRGQEYVLHLISEGGYFNYTERCGYSVKGKVSEMAQEIFKKHFPEYLWKDKLDIEQTADNFSFVLPWGYSPFKALTWLARKAVVGVDTDYSPFFFYESMDGYKFKSLNKIIEDGEKFKDKYYFVKSNVNRNIENNEGSGIKTGSASKLPSMYHRIQSLKEDMRFDMIENIGSGVIGSQMTVHDMMRKEKREYYFKESDIFEKVKKIGKNPHYIKSDTKESNEFFEKSNSAYFFVPFTPYTVFTDSNQITDNSRVEEYFLNRKYMVNTMLTQKLVVEIYGDSEKRVGQLMEVFVPKVAADGHLLDEPEDKNLSGDYIITSICHRFGKKYACRMELSRNCMGV